MVNEYQQTFSSDSPIETAPGSVFGIRAWRWWNTRPHNERLLKGHFEYWPKAEMEARCRLVDITGKLIHSEYSPPVEGCTCGIYAYWKLSPDLTPTSAEVFGVVEGYGKVMLGTAGFRAQSARIVALSATLPQHEWLVERYKVQVFTSVSEMLNSFPTTLEYCEEPATQPRVTSGPMLKYRKLY